MRSFFGDCDKKGGESHGKIMNTNPLWTKDKQIADMKDSISEIERQESEMVFVSGKVRVAKMRRKTILQDTLSKIKASDPRDKVKGKDLDKVRTAVDSFVEGVRALNSTHHDDDQAIKSGKSNVNPTLQGHYSKTPCIELKSEAEVEFANSCNLHVVDNKVSRDDATRAIWLGEPILGIRPDHLRLKRDKPSEYIGKASQVSVGDLPSDMGKQKIKQTA